MIRVHWQDITRQKEKECKAEKIGDYNDYSFATLRGEGEAEQCRTEK